MEAEDALDLLPASGSSGLKVENNGLESGSGSPEANLLVVNEERMGRDLDLVEEDLTTVGGEISAEQVSHVVAVDEKLRIHKETALDVCCILLLLEGCLHLNHYLLSQDSMSGILLSSSVLP